MSAELGLNITPFQAGLKKAESAGASAAASIATHFKGLVAGYFGVQALEAALKGVVGAMAAIKDQADQFSISTDEVQKLGAAAEEVGLKFEDMGAALLKFNQARKAMNEGDQGKIDAANFFKLGKGAFAGSGAKSMDLMQQVGANLPDKIDETTMNHLAELFGKSGPRLVEALRKFKEDNGPIIDAADIEAVDDAEASLRRLGRELRAEVAPAVGLASEALSSFLKAWKEVKAEGGSFQDVMVRAATRPATDMGAAISNGFGNLFGKAFSGPKKPEAKPEEIVNPAKAAEVRDIQEKLFAATEKYAFGRLTKEGQLAALKKKNLEYDADIATLTRFQADGKDQQLDKEKRIAELKMEQLETMQRIDALQKNSGDSDLQRGIYQARGFGYNSTPGSVQPKPAGSTVNPGVVDVAAFKGAVGQFKDAIQGGKFLRLGR